jgi:hypothetical protein
VARDSFLLRTDPQTMAALRKWADDELRSVNGQIEFLLRRALREAGRWDPVEGTRSAHPPASPGAEADLRTEGDRASDSEA